MQIEPFTLAELASLPLLQPPDWQDVTPHFRYYIEASYCTPLMVMDNGKLVGVGTAIRHRDTAWLAHIIVHPGRRSQGIGKMLTQALIDSIDRTRYKTIYLMATPLGEPVYRKLGFEAETEQLFFTEGRSFAAYKAPEAVRPYSEKYLDDILRMDREVSGEDRSVKLTGHFSNASVYISGNALKGYYLPDLGEGLIVAKDKQAGIELMQYRLADHPVAIVPVDNQAAVDFLNSHEFKVFRKATRMRLGKHRVWHAQHFYNRISGQIG
jgi:ribosomal protein S18 acetylase RimI-like enzyme